MQKAKQATLGNKLTHILVNQATRQADQTSKWQQTWWYKQTLGNDIADKETAKFTR